MKKLLLIAALTLSNASILGKAYDISFATLNSLNGMILHAGDTLTVTIAPQQAIRNRTYGEELSINASLFTFTKEKKEGHYRDYHTKQVYTVQTTNAAVKTDLSITATTRFFNGQGNQRRVSATVTVAP